MNSVDFCFWLQGFFEISDTNQLSERQVGVIKDHLNLVFVHEIDPKRESETKTPKETLNAVHAGKVNPALTGGYGNDGFMRC